MASRVRAVSHAARSDRVAFAAYSAMYVLVGAFIVLVRHIVADDAAARVAQAWYVIASRDPHIGAIGFVWNPLPSIAEIPLVALRGLWPALTRDMFAGTIVSSLFMAGAVVHLRACLREIGTAREATILLTAGMALSPMVILYGANGMSEAMYLCFLIGTARFLLRWTVTGHIRPLVWTALNLALAVLARYEALAAVAAVAVAVFAVGTTARDRARSFRDRALGGLSDAVVVALPAVAAFVAWSVVSWVIAGNPFLQFTSRYGNASIMRASGTAAANGTGWSPLFLAFVQMLAYAPVGLAIATAGVAIAWLRRDRRFLALVALAGPLLFSIAAYVRGNTFGFFRYYLPGLPLALLAVALLLHPHARMRPSLPSWLRPGGAGAIAVILAVVLSGFITTTTAMADVRIAPEEQPVVSRLLRSDPPASVRHATSVLDSAATIAHDVDALGLASGAVALDTFDCGSLVVLNSVNPHQFVITSDRDFERIVADPVPFHVPYLLVPNADKGIEAIGVAHPGIYNGGVVDNLRTSVVAEWHTPGCPDYRLIHVLSDGA